MFQNSVLRSTLKSQPMKQTMIFHKTEPTVTPSQDMLASSSNIICRETNQLLNEQAKAKTRMQVKEQSKINTILFLLQILVKSNPQQCHHPHSKPNSKSISLCSQCPTTGPPTSEKSHKVTFLWNLTSDIATYCRH